MTAALVHPANRVAMAGPVEERFGLGGGQGGPAIGRKAF